MLLFGSLKCEREESTIIDRKGYGMVYDYIRRLFMESEPLLLFFTVSRQKSFRVRRSFVGLYKSSFTEWLQCRFIKFDGKSIHGILSHAHERNVYHDTLKIVAGVSAVFFLTQKLASQRSLLLAISICKLY